MVAAPARENPQRFHWPPRFLKLLGRVPDRVIAARAGCVVTTVRRERRRRAIPPFQPQRPAIEWSDGMVALLGTAPDREVGAKLGIHKVSVCLKRRMLGIPPFRAQRGGRAGFRWTTQTLEMLGHAPDKEVAKRLHLSHGTVTTKRRLLGIPSFGRSPRRVRWTEEMLSLLGRIPDYRIARRFGITHSSVIEKRDQLGIPPRSERQKIARTPQLRALLRLTNRELREKHGLVRETARRLRKELGLPRPPDSRTLRWTDEMLGRLGKQSDAAIAAAMGMSADAVRYRRRALGIAPWSPPSQRWTERHSALLGTIADSELARRMGISIAAVRQKRKRMGIAPYPRGAPRAKRRAGE